MGTVSLLHKQEQLPGGLSSSLSPPSSVTAYGGEATSTGSGDELKPQEQQHSLCLSPRCPPDGAAFFESSPPNSSASSSPVTWSPTVSSACPDTAAVVGSGDMALHTSGDTADHRSHRAAFPIATGDGRARPTNVPPTQSGAKSTCDLKTTKILRPSSLIPPKRGDSRSLTANLSTVDSPLPSPPSVNVSNFGVCAATSDDSTAATTITTTTGTLQNANESSTSPSDHKSEEQQHQQPQVTPFVSSSSPPLPPPPPSPLRPPAVPSRYPVTCAAQKQLQLDTAGARKSPETCSPSPVILLQTQAISVKAPRAIRDANPPPVTVNIATTISSSASQSVRLHDAQSPVSPSNQQILYPASCCPTSSSSVPASAALTRDPNAQMLVSYLPEYRRQSSLPVATQDPFCIQDGRTVIPWAPRRSGRRSEEAALGQCTVDDTDTAVVATCAQARNSVQSVSGSRGKKPKDRHLNSQQTTGPPQVGPQTLNSPTADRSAGPLRRRDAGRELSRSGLVQPAGAVGYLVDHHQQLCSPTDAGKVQLHACPVAEPDTTSPQDLHELSNWTRAQLRSEQKAHRRDVRGVHAPQRSLSTRHDLSNPLGNLLVQLQSPTHPGAWQASELPSSVQGRLCTTHHQRRRAANSESWLLPAPHSPDPDLDLATVVTADHFGKPGGRQRVATVGGGTAGWHCGVPRRTSASLCDAGHQQPTTQPPSQSVRSPPHLSMSQSVVLLPSSSLSSEETSKAAAMPFTSGWVPADYAVGGGGGHGEANGEERWQTTTTGSNLLRSHSHRQSAAVSQAQQQQARENSLYYQRSVSHTVPLEVYHRQQASDASGEACWPPVLVHWHHRRRQAPTQKQSSVVVGHHRQHCQPDDGRHPGGTVAPLYRNGQLHYHSASAIFERLESQPWFHFNLSRAGAEKLLKPTTVGSFLVRQSETNKAEYSLSIKRDNDVLHMKISHDRMSGQYILGEYSQPYPSVSVMIYRYMHSLLPIRGTTPVLLRFPISRRCNGQPS